MSSAETTGGTPPESTGGDPPDAGGESAEVTEAVVDDRREAQLAELREHLGDAVLDTYVRPGQGTWARVAREAWRDTALVAKEKLGYEFFDFLSAVDWLPSPFGRDMNAQEDLVGEQPPVAGPAEIEHGYTGGETRFQVLASLYDTAGSRGILLKVDLPDDDLSIDTWSDVYPGANWHERETAEMFGIDFRGHPGLSHIYLPTDFEGHPLRKDYPLLARRVKPWPGIVDVEPMPAGEPDGEGEGGEGES